MKTLFKWLFILVCLAAIGGALLWSYHRHHESPEAEEAAGDAPEEIEASGADALAAQEVIEAAIRSHQSGGIPVDVPANG